MKHGSTVVDLLALHVSALADSCLERSIHLASWSTSKGLTSPGAAPHLLRAKIPNQILGPSIVQIRDQNWYNLRHDLHMPTMLPHLGPSQSRPGLLRMSNDLSNVGRDPLAAPPSGKATH